MAAAETNPAIFRLARRTAGCLLLASLLIAHSPVIAAECLITGMPIRLDSEFLKWTLIIANGQTCVRGLRSRSMTLESVAISSPAQFGKVTAQGYSFVYKAPDKFTGDKFTGEDKFSVTVSGANRGIGGASNIDVQVLVRDCQCIQK